VTDMVHLMASVDNGLHSGDLGNNFANAHGTAGYQGAGTDFSVTGRVDVKVMGDWKEEQGFAAFSDEENALFIGAAVNYAVAETGNNGTVGASGSNDKDVRLTVDAAGKMAGFNLSGAFVYDNFHADDATISQFVRGGAGDWWGFELQGGYMIVPDKFEAFGRYEWLNLKDAIPQSHPELVTAGVNYYVAKHRAKLTLDATWVFVGLPGGVTGSGAANTDLLNSVTSAQALVRGQVQLLF